MKEVLLGRVPSAASDDSVLVIGLPERVDSAIAVFESGDPDAVELVVTPRFDLDWIPESVRQLGVIDLSVLDGEFLEFPVGCQPELATALRRHGFIAVRDDARMRRAVGFTADED